MIRSVLVIRATIFAIFTSIPFWADIPYLERGGDLRANELAKYQNPSSYKGSIDLSGQNLVDLPNELMAFSKITRLDLGKNKFSNLSSKFKTFEHLRILKLEDNQIKAFDSANLPQSLEEIMLDGNPLKTFSAQKLRNLKLITMGQNAIKASDIDFSGLESLVMIYIWNNNQLTEIPSSTCTLKKLQGISATNNKLSEARLCYTNADFETLNLYKNQIKSIRIETSNVRQLLLQQNLIEELPKDFKNLDKLFVLRVENNLLKFVDNLPNSISYATFDRNQIERFSHNCNLRKLEFISLRDNRLRKIDFAPSCFPNLQRIDIRGNLDVKLLPGWLDLPQIELILVDRSQIDYSLINPKRVKDLVFSRKILIDEGDDF